MSFSNVQWARLSSLPLTKLTGWKRHGVPRSWNHDFMCLQAGGIFSLADACLHDQIFHLVSQPSPAPPQCPRRLCRGCLATLDFFRDIGLCLGLCLSNICGGYLLPALHLPCHQVYLPNDGSLSYTFICFSQVLPSPSTVSVGSELLLPPGNWFGSQRRPHLNQRPHNVGVPGAQIHSCNSNTWCFGDCREESIGQGAGERREENQD